MCVAIHHLLVVGPSCSSALLHSAKLQKIGERLGDLGTSQPENFLAHQLLDDHQQEVKDVYYFDPDFVLNGQTAPSYQDQMNSWTKKYGPDFKTPVRDVLFRGLITKIAGKGLSFARLAKTAAVSEALIEFLGLLSKLAKDVKDCSDLMTALQNSVFSDLETIVSEEVHIRAVYGLADKMDVAILQGAAPAEAAAARSSTRRTHDEDPTPTPAPTPAPTPTPTPNSQPQLPTPTAHDEDATHDDAAASSEDALVVTARLQGLDEMELLDLTAKLIRELRFGGFGRPSFFQHLWEQRTVLLTKLSPNGTQQTTMSVIKSLTSFEALFWAMVRRCQQAITLVFTKVVAVYGDANYYRAQAVQGLRLLKSTFSLRNADIDSFLERPDWMASQMASNSKPEKGSALRAKMEAKQDDLADLLGGVLDELDLVVAEADPARWRPFRVSFFWATSGPYFANLMYAGAVHGAALRNAPFEDTTHMQFNSKGLRYDKTAKVSAAEKRASEAAAKLKQYTGTSFSIGVEKTVVCARGIEC